jgi:hypothetical protein
MKNSRFSEEQIIGFEAERGRDEVGKSVPGVWVQRGRVLQLEVEVRRSDTAERRQRFLFNSLQRDCPQAQDQCQPLWRLLE